MEKNKQQRAKKSKVNGETGSVGKCETVKIILNILLNIKESYLKKILLFE